MRAVLGTVPDPNRDWVTFDASTTQLLRRYLDPSGIDELREACDFIGGLHHAQLSNPPSNTATRRSLKRIADVSDKLAACLDTSCSDFETLAATLEIGAGDGTGLHKTNELRKLLSVLALGCRKRAASLPRQVRRRTPEVQVRWLARVLEPRGIRASAASGSRFMRIIRTCFPAMGIHTDPARAVRSYVEHKGDKAFRD